MQDHDPATNPSTNPLELGRFLLGELPADRMAALKAAEAADPALAERLRLMRAHARADKIRYPAARMAAEIETRAGITPETRKTGSWISWIVPLLATALVMVVAWPPDRPTPASAPSLDALVADGVRPKASAEALQPKLRIYRQQQGDASLLADGAIVGAGDVIQVAYEAGEQGYGVIISVDGGGLVSLHLPPTSEGTTSLDGGGERRLERAWALGDGPGFERFWFVTSPLPLDVATVLKAVQATAAADPNAEELNLDISQKVGQQTFLLRKTVPE